MPPRNILEWMVGQRIPAKKKKSAVKVRLDTNDETEEDTVTVTFPRHGSAMRSAAERLVSKNVRFETTVGGEPYDSADDEKPAAPKQGKGKAAAKDKKKESKQVSEDSDTTLLPEDSQPESEAETATSNKGKKAGRGNKGKGGNNSAKPQNDNNKGNDKSENAESNGGDKTKEGKESAAKPNDKTKSPKSDLKPSQQPKSKSPPKPASAPNPALQYLSDDPNLIVPVQAHTVRVEHAFEDISGGQDPQPNAYFDPHSGRCRVYHGPNWGHRFRELYPQTVVAGPEISTSAPPAPKSPRELHSSSYGFGNPPPVAPPIPGKPAEYQPQAPMYYILPQQSPGHHNQSGYQQLPIYQTQLGYPQHPAYHHPAAYPQFMVPPQMAEQQPTAREQPPPAHLNLPPVKSYQEWMDRFMGSTIGMTSANEAHRNATHNDKDNSSRRDDPNPLGPRENRGNSGDKGRGGTQYFCKSPFAFGGNKGKDKAPSNGAVGPWGENKKYTPSPAQSQTNKDTGWGENTGDASHTGWNDSNSNGKAPSPAQPQNNDPSGWGAGNDKAPSPAQSQNNDASGWGASNDKAVSPAQSQGKSNNGDAWGGGASRSNQGEKNNPNGSNRADNTWGNNGGSNQGGSQTGKDAWGDISGNNNTGNSWGKSGESGETNNWATSGSNQGGANNWGESSGNNDASHNWGNPSGDGVGGSQTGSGGGGISDAFFQGGGKDKRYGSPRNKEDNENHDRTTTDEPSAPGGIDEERENSDSPMPGAWDTWKGGADKEINSGGVAAKMDSEGRGIFTSLCSWVTGSNASLKPAPAETSAEDGAGSASNVEGQESTWGAEGPSASGQGSWDNPTSDSPKNAQPW